MKTHSSANDTLIDVAEKLQEQMDQKGARSNVILSKNRMQTFNEYAFLFATNFNSIIDSYDLNRSEIRVVLKLIEYMYFGNLLSFSNAKLSKDLNIDPSNVSKILKRLKKTELIIEDEGNMFFNPHIACKGVLDERDLQQCQLLDYSAIILEKYNNNATPSIGTPNIRKRKTKKELSNNITSEIKEFYGNDDK